jgi:RNA polymerase sigma-70 factor (ECF subfamily)
MRSYLLSNGVVVPLHETAAGSNGFSQFDETDRPMFRIMRAWRDPPDVERDERDLVEQCLAGNQDACATLVDAYARMVGTVIWRATGDRQGVEDLAQEAFLRVFRALPYFDARARLSTWIYTIAHRVAIDHLRKAGRWREGPLPFANLESGDDPFDRLPSSSLDPEAALSREDSERLIRDGLAQLPEKYRLPLVYAAIDGLDYPTIAAMFGVPIGTIKTLIFRGKRLLRDRIAKRVRRPKPRERSNAL